MKKLICAAVVLAVNTSVFASEEPKKPVVQINGLRASSEVIAIIPVAKKRMARDGDVNSPSSSGSSPVGAEYLFPGQPGGGFFGKSMAPVSSSDQNIYSRESFFYGS